MLFLLPVSVCYFQMGVGRDFVDGTVTRYGLKNSVGVISFPPVQAGTGIHPASCLFPSDKAAGAWG
jgi:hypothetical protein